MIQSQIGGTGYSTGSSSSVNNNAFYSVKNNSNVSDRFMGTSSRVNVDPMKDSTMIYVRNVYKNFGNLPD